MNDVISFVRTGEIVRLTWDNVDLEKRVAKREVPLSEEAFPILEQVK